MSDKDELSHRHIWRVGKPADSSPGGDPKNPAAVALGRLGGMKGGKARAIRLTANRRSEIARKAAEARWRREQDVNE